MVKEQNNLMITGSKKAQKEGLNQALLQKAKMHESLKILCESGLD